MARLAGEERIRRREARGVNEMSRNYMLLMAMLTTKVNAQRLGFNKGKDWYTKMTRMK